MVETLPPTAGDELVLFVTPSGNIGCGMDAAWVRCDLREADWELPPHPDGCELDHLHGAELGSEAFIGVCAGDTVLGGSEVVPYGSGIRRGPMVCESAATGLTCRNEVTGAGFRLSRSAAERF